MPPVRREGSSGTAQDAPNAAKFRGIALDDQGESSTAGILPPLTNVEHVLPPLARYGLSANYDAARSPVASVLHLLAAVNSRTLGGTDKPMPRLIHPAAAKAPASSKRPAERSPVASDDDDEDAKEERRPHNFQERMAAVRGESPPAKRMRTTGGVSASSPAPAGSLAADEKPAALSRLESVYSM